MLKGYYSSPSVGIANATRIGDALDRAPRPYTASELAGITGCGLNTVRAFLARNLAKEAISVRLLPSTGRSPLHEYWRGREPVEFTFAEAAPMDEEIGKAIKEGRRPVAWRDGERTTWSIDEAEGVCAMQGSRLLRFGRAERITDNKTSVSIRTQSITLTFTKRRS